MNMIILYNESACAVITSSPLGYDNPFYDLYYSSLDPLVDKETINNHLVKSSTMTRPYILSRTRF